jgi:hypothetical protein
VSFIIEYKCTTFFSNFLGINYTLGWKGIMNHNLTISIIFGLLSRNPKTFCHFDATPITIVEYHRREDASSFPSLGYGVSSEFGFACGLSMHHFVSNLH